MIEAEAQFDAAADDACSSFDLDKLTRAFERYNMAWQLYVASKPSSFDDVRARLQCVFEEACRQDCDSYVAGDLAPLRPKIGILVADFAGQVPVADAAARIRNALADAEGRAPASDYTQILRGIAAWLLHPRLVS